MGDETEVKRLRMALRRIAYSQESDLAVYSDFAGEVAREALGREHGPWCVQGGKGDNTDPFVHSETCRRDETASDALRAALAASETSDEAQGSPPDDRLREAAEEAFAAINALHGDLGPDHDAPWHKYDEAWNALSRALWPVPVPPTTFDPVTGRYPPRASVTARLAATPSAQPEGLAPAGVKAAMEDNIRRAYARGHYDGINCDADAGFGIGECEHVGRFASEPVPPSASPEPVPEEGTP